MLDAKSGQHTFLKIVHEFRSISATFEETWENRSMNLIDTAILWPRKVVEATTPYNLLSIDWAHSVLTWFDRSGRQICYLCDWSVNREHDGLYLAFHRFFPVSFRGRFDWVEKTSLAIHTSNPYNCALWNTGNDCQIDQKKEQQSWTRLRPEFKSCSFSLWRYSFWTHFGPNWGPFWTRFLFLIISENDF